MPIVSRVQVALAITVVLWASAFVAIRIAAPDYPIGAFLLLRFAIPAVILGGWALRRRALVPRRADWLGVGTLGGLFALYLVLLVAGERTVDGGTASMLAETSPLITVALAAIFLSERAGVRLVLGLAIALVGAAVIAREQGGGGLQLGAGALLVLGAAAAQAAMFVVQKPLLARQSAMVLVAQATTIGAVVTMPFAGQLVHAIRTAPASATWAVVFVALTTGAVSYVTFAYAIANSASTARVSSVLYLVPPVAVAMSWIAVGERPTVIAALGGVLALGGVAIATRR